MESLRDKPDPYVVPFHTQWLELPPNKQQYSDEAISFVAQALRGDFDHDRVGRLSPSMLGYCPRKNLFTYAGAPRLGEDPDSQDLMGLGKWGHLRWQAEGLTYPFMAPYMVETEKWVFDETLRFGGSIDAILRDGSGFDLKTAHFGVYNKHQDSGMKWEWRLQRAGYYMLTGIEVWSWVMEERGSGDYYEFRDEHVDRDTEAYDAAEGELEMLNGHIDEGTLPSMLDDCSRGRGKIYRGCPFRKVCPKMNSIADAEKAGLEAKEAA